MSSSPVLQGRSVRRRILVPTTIVIGAALLAVLVAIGGVQRVVLRGLADEVEQASAAVDESLAAQLSEATRHAVHHAGASLEAKGDSLAGLVAGMSVVPLLGYDTETLNQYCAQLAADDDVLWSAVLEPDGTPRTTWSGEGDPALAALFASASATPAERIAALDGRSDVIRLDREVRTEGQRLGSVVVYLARTSQAAQATAAQRRGDAALAALADGFDRLQQVVAGSSTAALGWTIALGAAVALAAALAGAWRVHRVARTIAEPLERAAAVVRRVAEGDLREPSELLAEGVAPGDDEVAQLGCSLAQTLQSLRVALQADRVRWDDVVRSREELAQVMTMVHHLPTGLVLADAARRIRYANPAAIELVARLRGGPADPLVGAPLERVLAGCRELPAGFATSATVPQRARLAFAQEHVDVAVAPLLDAGGAVVGTTAALVAVTEQVAAEQRARELAQRQQESALEMARLAEQGRAASERASAEERRRATELRRHVDAILVVVKAAAQGDLTRVAQVDDDGAVGQVAREVGDLLGTLRASIGRITGTADLLAEAGRTLATLGRDMQGLADDAAGRAQEASRTAAAAKDGLSSAASGSEELNASIRDIATNTSRSAEVARAAVESASGAIERVGRLRASSERIGEVVGLIGSIAAQTNLLALNATIEAARAGEAGRGFAVVANEVKSLAHETARATDEVHRTIRSIQGETQAAAHSIDAIAGVIREIDERGATIAGAVTQQSATTGELSRSVNGAAHSIVAIAESFEGVTRAAEQTHQRVRQSLETVERVQQLVAELRQSCGRFQWRSAAVEAVESSEARALVSSAG